MLFIFFSLDDAIKLHERLGDLAERYSDKHEEQLSIFDKFSSYSWLLLYLPFLFLFGSVIIVILWREFSSPLLRFLLFGCFACYGGALVLEYFEGLNDAHKYVSELFAVRYKHVRYSSKALEELLEMVGTASFLLAVALHGVDRIKPGLAIRVLDHQARSPDESATR